MSQAINQVIPEGYKQTEIGIIPSEWSISQLGELVVITSGESPSKFDFISEGVPYFKVEQLNNGHVYAEETEYRIKTKKTIPAGSIIFPKRGASILLNKIRMLKKDSFMDTNLMTLTCLPNLLDNMFLYNILIYQGLDKVADTTSIPQINNKHIIPFIIPIPVKAEQTAIANALSDVDALLSELENLIAKKQAIKTATMQQLLTGKTRLPQFAFYSDINSPEGAVEGKRKHSSATIVNDGPSDDGSLASQESGGMDSLRKNTKASELGEIPGDWEVVGFGELFERLLSRKNLKDDTLTTFVGMQDVSENAQLVKQTPIMVSKVRSGFTYFEKGDVLVAKITPCFENGKGCHTKTLDTETGFGSTEFHVLRAKHQADSDFIYFWTTRDIFRKDLEREMVGSAGHRRVPFLAIQNYKIPCPPTIEEQTAIASILSDMNSEIQTLEQRLSKTRQIKQGMMQELLTGKTRLPFDKIADKE
jgi:type I restriction enzyme S subunit